MIPSVATASAKSAPTRPEDEREDKADNPDYKENRTGDLNVESRNFVIDGPSQYRACGNEEKTKTYTHTESLADGLVSVNGIGLCLLVR